MLADSAGQRYLGIMCIAVAIFAGCTTTKHGGPILTPAVMQAISHEPGGQGDKEVELDSGMGGGGAEPVHPIGKLVTVDEQTMILRVRHEGVSTSTMETVAVPNKAVRRIVVTDRSRGAQQGALVGLCTAVGLAGVAYADGGCESDGHCFFNRGQLAAAVGLVTLLPSLLIGAAIGAAVGAKTEYVFRTDR